MTTPVLAALPAGVSLVTDIVRYANEAPLFEQQPYGWLMHVQDGHGDPTPYFNSLKSPNRAFGHYWLGQKGEVKLNQQLRYQAWAARGGNTHYWQVEFEGLPSEALTPLQIEKAARIHIALGTVDRLANLPNEQGVGTHSMGGDAWGHPHCPGPIRARQRGDIIALAVSIRTASQHPYPGVMAEGMGGGSIVVLQRRLKALGYRLAVDGVFGPITRAVVRDFQRSKRITIDGVVGRITWAHLWTV